MRHRFGQGFCEIILRAEQRQQWEGARCLSSRHLLWGLKAERTLPAALMLARMGIAPGVLAEALEELPPCENLHGSAQFALTCEARDAVDHACHALAAL